MAVHAILLVVCSAVLCRGQQLLSNGYIRHQLELDGNYPPIHLILDNANGTVYVSAVNRLYQLNKSLDRSTLIEVHTGPKEDSINCLPYERCDPAYEKTLKLTNNYNKLFLMDTARNRLIVCGSIYQGICEARSMFNISHVVADNPCKNKTPEDCNYQSYLPISCITKNCTCAGVITEGPTVDNPVMYIATTVVNHLFGDKRNAISTRSLNIDPTKENDIFGYVIDDIQKKSKLLIPGETDNAFIAYFKYVFATEGLDGFVYFVFSKEGRAETVISRLCKKDPLLRSYIAMNLTCEVSGNGKLVNAHYQKSMGSQDMDIDDGGHGALYVTFRNENGSSVCLYTLKDINKAFDDAILACYKHRGKNSDGEVIVVSEGDKGDKSEKCNVDAEKSTWMTGGDSDLHDKGLQSSTDVYLKYYSDYKMESQTYRCGPFYLPKVLELLRPLSSSWSYYQPGLNFSGITVDLVEDQINVAYIGTLGGDVIELDVNHKNIFNTIRIGSPVIPELVLDKHPSLPVPHLYVMTENKISYVKASVCSRLKTCQECLGAQDPYCGWCILTSSCVPKSSECPSNSWLKPLSEQCIEANVHEPLERSLQENMTIQVKLLPSLLPGDSYKCLFDGKYKSSATVDLSDKEVIVCQAPDGNLLPNNFPGEDYVNVPLSIVYNDEVEIVSTNATFYECEAHGKTINNLQPCQSCLVNQWKNKCSWCVHSNKCVPMGPDVCLTSEPHCPMIWSENNPQLIPAGVNREIVLKVKNLPNEASDNMLCKVMIEEDKFLEVKASLSDSSRSQITCKSRKYDYNQEQSEISSNVSVVWKPGYVIDVEAFNTIAFYKCSVSRVDCSRCVTANSKYKCGWCGSECVIEDLCTTNWVTDDAECPGPQITSFTPLSGPVSGNTTIDISGTNMGVRLEDVEKVTVAGVDCIPQEDLYEVSNRVVCRIISPLTLSPKTGKVLVTVRGITARSKEDFSFKSPDVQTVATPEGPVSGGTWVKIVGKDLDVGGEKLVDIGEFRCKHPRVLTDTTMVCQSSDADAPKMNLTVTVFFDGHPVKVPSAFSYIEDPEITSFSTATGKLACFLAGGRDIVFTGQRLNIVQNANLIALLSRDTVDRISAAGGRRRRHVRLATKRSRLRRSLGADFKSKCRVENSTTMICPTPEINGTLGSNAENNVSDLALANSILRLEMDNINIEVRDRITGQPAKLIYFPNPNILDLDPKKELRSDSLLDIHALNLNRDAVDDSEVIVRIGDQPCQVDSITDKGSIRCNVPPKPEGDQTSFLVSVHIGSKKWDVGEVTYFIPEPSFPEGLKIFLIILGVIVPIIVIALIVYCVRKQKHYKNNKNDFQKAIETLEMTVQADFRKAFAELSTDMSDLTADIGDVGLPILSYRQYATNMFFPSYHPCMKEPNPNEKPIAGVHQGFVQFDLLITNKQFLMAFIRTLEQQRGFSNRDKGNVASLITVVLHKKLDYFTEVMKSLISELVETSVERNPKVVLRRTESVAERMFSNWLAICLFRHIRDKVGTPLFLLQKAIKHQVSKGALDEITGKTRYTLSDDSLLKEDIPCETLTLFISQKEMNPDDPLVIKVLSCDTISQVKEKIMDAVYKRVPFSQRPKPEVLDLEWRHGRSGHLVLPDTDHVNEQGSRWRRVMTIKDYKVDDNATMTLIPREQKNDDANISHLTDNGADTSVVSPMLPEESTRVYHLAKYADDIENKRESSILRDKHKHILDLYLLRLINMKGILQNYVDDVFRSILDTSSVPPAVKHFFDFLDELAKSHNISNEEILHLWKTNSVLGRFWVTLLKNPELVFDIDKPDSVASSMAVISQTFIDACSVQEHQPTKDSPINKQLYAKEIPNYKKLVQKYYADVRQLQPVSDQDMCAHMTEISRSHGLEFDVHAAHNELWGYVNKYYEEIQETLSSDPSMTQMVIQRLQQAYTLIDSSINNP